MTSYDFYQPNNDAFQFQPILDGNAYNVIVTWNIFGMRYYINIYDQYNNFIVCMPVIGSTSEKNISMTAGYFNTQLIYRSDLAQFITL